MRILVDADGCPVVDITINIAKKYNIECILICDTSHFFERDGARTIVVSKGADSVDFALVNMLVEGDIVITQDYGLAAMCMAKRVNIINQNGYLYTSENIEGLLLQRHTSKRIRNTGGRVKGPRKREKEQDIAFEKILIDLIKFKEEKND